MSRRGVTATHCCDAEIAELWADGAPIGSVILRDVAEARQGHQLFCMSPCLGAFRWPEILTASLEDGTRDSGFQRQTGAHRGGWKRHFPIGYPGARTGSLSKPTKGPCS